MMSAIPKPREIRCQSACCHHLWMLSGTGDRYSTGILQAAILLPTRNRFVLWAWLPGRNLKRAPPSPPISGILQKNSEDLATFIDRVEKSLQRKFPPGPLRDQFVKMLVWEGMTADHKLARASLKDRNMGRWVIATKDVGAMSHQNQTMASLLKASQKENPDTLVSVLQQAFPRRGKSCFGCGQEGHFKRECPHKQGAVDRKSVV